MVRVSEPEGFGQTTRLTDADRRSASCRSAEGEGSPGDFRSSARRPASRNPIFREDCGGWRVSEILWYARVMGLNDTSIYSDGWIAWSDEGRPFVTGEPAAK